MKRLALWVALAAAGLSLLITGPSAAQPVPSSPSRVIQISLDGAVDPLAARYVERGVRRANDPEELAVLLRIDTPGGLDSSMRKIVKAIQGSTVPVICWVGPSGSRAASAGAIIMLGCPNTAMAPGTNIGAAHPVGFSGEVLSEKVTNDAAAYARALAEQYGRDAATAEAMVRRSVSLSARQALDRKLIQVVAASEREALRAFEGRPLRRAGGQSVLPVIGPPHRLSGAPIERFEMTFMESLLHNAVDPNVAFLLLTLGLLGIAVEILHPGITIGGVFGGLAFFAALVILGMLPVNIAGALLIVGGIGLMVLEAFVPGGIVGALGAIALLLGGLFLFDTAVPGARVSTGLVVGTVVAIVASFFVVLRAVMRTRRQSPSTPTTDDLVGLEGVVERALEPSGTVRARNESWSARAAAGPIPAGAHVRVTRVQGLTLEVEPVEAARATDSGTV